MAKIFIDPRARLVYASFYLKGLFEIYGEKNVKYSMKYFKDLKQNGNSFAFDQYFAFIVYENNKLYKIIVDYRDKIEINKEAYDWCDSYGKVNYNIIAIDKNDKKIIPIGPGFGIKIYGVSKTIYYCISNYIKCFLYLHVSARVFLSGYIWQLKRLPYSLYKPVSGDKNYLFFVSSLWDHANCIEKTNLFRATYIRYCKSIGIKFEGGIFAKPYQVEYSKYSDIVYSKYIMLVEYIKKVKVSTLSFNTPSVWDCHGWKLGEFLALGKAIISTPLSNEMPVPMTHGMNIHFVYDEDDLKKGIHKILNNDAYRQKLENGAYEYYNHHIKPEIVIKNLLSNVAVV